MVKLAPDYQSSDTRSEVHYVLCDRKVKIGSKRNLEERHYDDHMGWPDDLVQGGQDGQI